MEVGQVKSVFHQRPDVSWDRNRVRPVFFQLHFRSFHLYEHLIHFVWLVTKLQIVLSFMQYKAAQRYNGVLQTKNSKKKYALHRKFLKILLTACQLQRVFFYH